jgi:hypothetical protein
MTSLTTDRDALTRLTILDSADVESIAWQPVPDCPGVEQKVLWHLGAYTEALLRLAPAATTPGHPHLAAHHHVWVVSGRLTLAGRELTAGSYVHVPPGVDHAFRAGPGGCVVLQMHRPHPPVEAMGLLGA